MGQVLYGPANHIREQAKIDAARITTASGNEKRAAISALGAFSQSLGNQRRMDAAGQEVNSISENVGRNLDAAATGKLSMRVQAAEQLGASVADAAAAGVGGSSIDAYNATLSLSQSMAEEQGERAINTENIAAGRARADTISNAVAGFGNDRYNADLDFSQYVDHVKQSGFARVATLAGAAAATYFGGPQAGQAVLSFSESLEQAKNGDMAGASRSVNSAITGISAGVKAYRAGATPDADGKSNFGSAWGKRAFSASFKG